jgi:hypothetical protein
MKTIRIFLLILVTILFFGGCASTVSSYIERQMPSLPDNQHITVFGLSDTPPVNSQNIAFISIGDSGFSVNCSYSEVVDTAVQECRRLGGNALKITSITEPDFFGSTCYRISATALYINN